MPGDQKTYKKLKLLKFKLFSLLEITKEINENTSSKELFNHFEFILKNQLSIGRAVLFSKQGKHWKCVLKFGVKGTEKKFNIGNDLEHFKDITTIESSSKEHLNFFDVVIPVYHKNVPLAYLILGDLNEEAIRMSPVIKHLTFIQTLTSIISVAIENKRLAKQDVKQEGMKKELELASEMQKMLFPEELPNNHKIQLAAYYKPHHQVGGDYYDYIEITENVFLFCLADVSGKGVSAALLMSNFQANLRALVSLNPTLENLVHQLNEKVFQTAKGEKFITLFIAKYNTVSRELVYVNAAHNPPILKSGSETQFLDKGCTGLGLFDEIPKLEVGIVKIIEMSTLMCYTDGVVELENDAKQEYGTNRLISYLKNSKALGMKKLNKELVAELAIFKEDQPYIDDIALLSCKFF
jgi:sigma-B regulation protein RsbU (phosphoserine phosphatase)